MDPKLVAEIEAERDRQNANWEERPASQFSWIFFARRLMGLLTVAETYNDAKAWRLSMIRLAALAVEAVIWFDKYVVNQGNDGKPDAE